jgi:hypothetical protein
MEKIDKPFGRAFEKLLEEGTKAYAAETEKMKKRRGQSNLQQSPGEQEKKD